jgi:hypothetical protein
MSAPLLTDGCVGATHLEEVERLQSQVARLYDLLGTAKAAEDNHTVFNFQEQSPPNMEWV